MTETADCLTDRVATMPGKEYRLAEKSKGGKLKIRISAKG